MNQHHISFKEERHEVECERGWNCCSYTETIATCTCGLVWKQNYANNGRQVMADNHIDSSRKKLVDQFLKETLGFEYSIDLKSS